jgi:hypothetical protein
VPLVYCDHNFIVAAGQEPNSYKDHLRQLGAAGTVTFVLSPFHWVEMAEDADYARAEAKADFVDSLHPKWLFERRNIQGKEVKAAFFRFTAIPSDVPEMVADAVDVIADLAGQRAYRDSRAFVTHLRGIGPNHPLEQSLREALTANQANIVHYQAGRLTSDVMRRTETLYVERLLPLNTPAGLVIDADSKRRFLAAQQLTDFPSFALETRATKDNWAEARQMSHNNFLDQQHIMALPYVDFFITDDRRLTTLIARIVADAPFRCATVITKTQFDCLYP